MAVKNISVFTDIRQRESGMTKTFEIDIINLTAAGEEEIAEMQGMDIEDLKMLKRELENSIELEKMQNNDIRIANII